MALPGCRKQAERRLRRPRPCSAASVTWNSPASTGAASRGRCHSMPTCVLARRGHPTAVLASGDPFWHGAGGSLGAATRAGRMDRASVALDLLAGGVAAGLAARNHDLHRASCRAVRAAGAAVVARCAHHLPGARRKRRCRPGAMADHARLGRLAPVDVVGAGWSARTHRRGQGGQLRRGNRGKPLGACHRSGWRCGTFTRVRSCR